MLLTFGYKVIDEVICAEIKIDIAILSKIFRVGITVINCWHGNKIWGLEALRRGNVSLLFIVLCERWHWRGVGRVVRVGPARPGPRHRRFNGRPPVCLAVHPGPARGPRIVRENTAPAPPVIAAIPPRLDVR